MPSGAPPSRTSVLDAVGVVLGVLVPVEVIVVSAVEHVPARAALEIVVLDVAPQGVRTFLAVETVVTFLSQQAVVAAAAAVPFFARSTGNVPTTKTCEPKMQNPITNRISTDAVSPW